MSRVALFCAVFVATAVPALPRAHAGAGMFDPTFGTGGKVTTVVGVAGGGTFGTVASSVVLQSDGKIVVLGNAYDGTSQHPVLVRYATDGKLDPAFNGTGVLDPGLSVNSLLPDVVLQSDGKLVLAGLAGSNVVIARYTADGMVDSTFNSTGQVVIAGLFNLRMALQVDGKIVVLGDSSGSNSFELARYNDDGTLDTAGFGSGSGEVITPMSGSNPTPSNLALQSDGKIVVIGFTGTYPHMDMLVVRYLTDGTLDASFGSMGIVTTDFADGVDVPDGVSVQPDGKIVVVGISSKGGGGSPEGVVRYNADGTLDTTFHHTGRAPLPLSIYGDSIVAIQADGKILAVGAVSKGSVDVADFAIARFLPNGSLDTGFGKGGTARLDFGGGEIGLAVAVQSDGRIVVAGTTVAAGTGGDAAGQFAVARLVGGAIPPLDPPVPPPVQDTTTMTSAGAAFLEFGAPAVDSGIVGGAAVVRTGNAPKRTVIYGGANGDELATTGGPDGGGATFTALGDPIFAGEALGFAATVETPMSLPERLLGLDLRAFAVRPGGRLGALYSQLSKAGGIHRLAAQAGSAPGGGQYANFGGFGLPRQRVGLLYAALLHHDGQSVTPQNDSGIWRERSDGSGTDLLLRTGQRNGFSRGATGRGLAKLTFMPPVPNATDQRLSHAPDGGLAVTAKFDDGTTGVVAIAADGTPSVPLDTGSDVPDEAGTADGAVEFVRFLPPATASGNRLALLAALKAAQRGQPAPPAQAIFANTGGTMQRMLARGDSLSGSSGPRFGALGQPLLGEKGTIGLIAALTGKGVTPASKKVLLRIDGGTKTVVARLGDQVPDYGPGVVFRKFMSVVVTDSDPARMVFTALVAGPGVNGSNNVGLWSHSAALGTKLVLRNGGTIQASGQTLTVRSFEALQAPKKSQGQGRATDASGFVTAKAKLSDGRTGVLRVPLP